MTRVRIDAINPTAPKKAAAKAKPDADAAPAEAVAEKKSAPRVTKPRAKKVAADAEPAPEKPKARRAAKPKAEE